MKKQLVKKTSGSTILAIASAVIYAIEDSVVDLDPGVVYIHPPLLEEVAEKSSIEVEVYGVEELGEKKLEVPSGGVEVKVSRAEGSPPLGSMLLRDLYSSLPALAARLDSAILKSLSLKTMDTSVEYTVMYALDGRMYVLEGEENAAPVFPVRVAGVVHTHPAGYCGFSSRDVRVAARLLDSYSIFSAVVSSGCIYYLARVGFLSPDDYVLLLNYSRELDEEIRLRSVVGRRLPL